MEEEERYETELDEERGGGGGGGEIGGSENRGVDVVGVCHDKASPCELIYT